jgi:restriction endonuclease Mrr
MLEEKLEGILKASSFHVLLLIVSNVLSREGYSDVQLLGRRTTKQKSYIGGCDLIAHQRLGVFITKTLVKVIQDDVRIRMLDEMTGAMPRTSANFGIIVTPKGVTERVEILNSAYPGHPVRIITGKELARLMVANRLGVLDFGGELRPDYRYFQNLHDRSRQLLAYLKSMDRELR